MCDRETRSRTPDDSSCGRRGPHEAPLSLRLSHASDSRTGTLRRSWAALAVRVLVVAWASTALPATAQVSCPKLRWDSGANGAEAEIGCGSKHGVSVGMTGVLRPAQAGQPPLAAFKVVNAPDPETTWVTVTDVYGALDPFAEMTAMFDQDLATQLRGHPILSVDSATRTAVVAAGCRQGVRDGLRGQIVRKLRDADQVDVTLVATLSVVTTTLDTCTIAWVPQGPGQMPAAGESEAVIVGLAQPPQPRSPTLISGTGGVDSRISFTIEGQAVGTRCALVRQDPSGHGDQQYGEALIESVVGDRATAVIVPPILPGARVSQTDAVVPHDASACEGLPPRHWSSEEFRQAQVQELERQISTAEASKETETSERTLAELRELRRMVESLASKAQEPAPSPRTAATPAAPVSPASSVLHAVSPSSGDVVDGDGFLTWIAEEHCANRDLALRIEAVTDDGRRVEFQEQVGQGQRGKMRVESMIDRIRGQMKKRETVRGFSWYVLNMQPPPKKENCITEKRTVVLAVPIFKN